MPQVELPIEHYQIDGVYARSMFIPAGTILTGKIHNFESIAILAKGRIRITNGTESYIVSEGHIMVDKPGVKRLGYAETDVVFITVHRTDNIEIEAIEKELVSATFEEYQQQLLLGDLP
jgi:quercetin dioxygenase-like cupin family protein